MSGKHLSKEERNELNKLTKHFTNKLTQILVQSRLGEKIHTISSSSKASLLFNLMLEDNLEIQQEANNKLGDQVPDVDKPLCVDIMLQTPDHDQMVLEVWSLEVSVDHCDTTNPSIYPTVYQRFTLLLKSALTVSRITPAYHLSFSQSKESHVILYNIHLGNADISSVGKDAQKARVGQVATPLSTLTLYLHYRTNMTLPSQSRNIMHDPIMLKSDHFKSETSPKYNRKISDRSNHSIGITQNIEENADVNNSPFYNNPTCTQPEITSENNESPATATSEVIMEKKVSAAFADYKPANPEDFIVNDISFSSLFLGSKIEENSADKKSKDEETIINSSTSNNVEKKNSVSEEMAEKTSTGSDVSLQSTLSASAMKKDDYVLVELKTPFVGKYDNASDLGAFYRACQNAPTLQSFSEEQKESSVNDLDEQLLLFEASVSGYDELVKSLHEDSPNSEG